MFAGGGALLLMALALVHYATAPLPPPRKLSLEAYTTFLSDYIQEFRKLLLVLAQKAAELEQRGVHASKAAASLEAEHRALGNALNERLLLKHRTAKQVPQFSLCCGIHHDRIFISKSQYFLCAHGT